MSDTETKNAVATTADAALPSFLQGRARSDENAFDAKDMTIPRIKIAQGLSPEVKDGTVVDGAQFLNITGETLAAPGEPLRFIVVIASKEYILWRDRKDNGGGLLARARPVRVAVKDDDGNETGETVVKHKWDKPHTAYDVKVGGVQKQTWEIGEFVEDDGSADWGSSIKDDPDSVPMASVHYNYLVVLPDYGNTMAAFSLSKSGVKRARDLNALLSMSNLDSFARFFTATTAAEKADGNDFFNVKFKPKGTMKQEDADLFAFCEAQHRYFVEAGFVVSQDQEDTPAEGGKKATGKKF